MPHASPQPHRAPVRLFPKVPRSVSRPISFLVVLVWIVQMGLLVRRSYLSAPVALAADLAQYGSSAQWKGIYYRGEKIGFSVGQTLPQDGGYELREDGRLQLTLLGATSAVRLHATARVDAAFALREFDFSLDPGTGPTQIKGTLQGRRLDLTIKSPSGERHETRELTEDPALPLSFSRKLAASGGLVTGRTHVLHVFDPASLRNAPMEMTVGPREVVDVAGRPTPAFKVATRFSGVAGTSWITDVGEVVREESPIGMMVVRENRRAGPGHGRAGPGADRPPGGVRHRPPGRSSDRRPDVRGTPAGPLDRRRRARRTRSAGRRPARRGRRLRDRGCAKARSHTSR